MQVTGPFAVSFFASQHHNAQKKDAAAVPHALELVD